MTTTTTTTTPSPSGLFMLPEPLGVIGMDAVSEAARSATLAQNRAGATRLEAAHVLVEQLARADRAEAAERAQSGGAPRPAYARLDPHARARDHLAAACQLTCWHATRLVTAGVQIHTRLPGLRSAVGRGLLPEQMAIDLACRLAEVPDGVVGAVERDVVSSVAGDLDGGDRPSRSAVDSLVDQALERHSPRDARDAVDAAARQRAVRIRAGRNGTGTVWARLSIADAELLRQRLEDDARAALDDGSPRTMDELRADALAALAVYNHPGRTTSVAVDGGDDTFEVVEPVPGIDLPRPSVGNAAAAGGRPIRISVIAAAAAGLPNRVEFVHGAYSSFDWLCQELLDGDDARVRFETIDAAPGALDSPEHALRYVITPAMAERIRLRDGTCRHPGCSVAARDCDIDHVIAFNTTDAALGGPTTEWNLVCLCRKHHREKTFGKSAYRPGPLGELIITTETGHQHRTRPKGPLARAREQIRHEAWNTHIDRLIADDGYLTNPPA